MVGFLFTGSVLSFLVALGIMGWAPTSVQELGAFVFMLISAVLFVGGAQVREVQKSREVLEEALESKTD